MRSSKPAVILVGHGSHEPRFAKAMERVARELRKSRRFSGVLCAYLEITRPSIEEAIEGWAAKNAKEIRILPYFVLSGRHVRSHIPKIVAAAKPRHRGVKITLCPYLGYDERIVILAKKRLSGKQ